MNSNTRKVLTLVILMMATIGAFAQQKQGDVNVSNSRNLGKMTTIGQSAYWAYYALNAKDMNDPNTYIDYQLLEIGNDRTKYSSYFLYQRDYAKLWPVQRIGGATVRQGAGGRFPGRWSEYQFSELYIKDDSCEVYVSMPLLMDPWNCHYPDTYASQQWKLEAEKDSICGYPCQKATCHWRGRDFVAWFAASIPMRYGPWLFGGLPGLILKLYDTKHLYTFECVGFEKKIKPIQKPAFPSYRQMKRAEVLKLQSRINRNYFRTAFQSMGTEMPEHLNKSNEPYESLELE